MSAWVCSWRKPGNRDANRFSRFCGGWGQAGAGLLGVDCWTTCKMAIAIRSNQNKRYFTSSGLYGHTSLVGSGTRQSILLLDRESTPPISNRTLPTGPRHQMIVTNQHVSTLVDYLCRCAEWIAENFHQTTTPESFPLTQKGRGSLGLSDSAIHVRCDLCARPSPLIIHHCSKTQPCPPTAHFPVLRVVFEHNSRNGIKEDDS